MTPETRAIRAVLLALPCGGPWHTRRLLALGGGMGVLPSVEVQGIGVALLSLELRFRWFIAAGGDPEILAPLGGTVPSALEQLELRGLAFDREAFADEPTVGLSEVYLSRKGHDWLRAHEPQEV